MSIIFQHEGHDAAKDAAYIASLEAAGMILPVTYTTTTWPIPRRVQKLLAVVVGAVVNVAPFAF